jgi:hypothetical protein
MNRRQFLKVRTTLGSAAWVAPSFLSGFDLDGDATQRNAGRLCQDNRSSG